VRADPPVAGAVHDRATELEPAVADNTGAPGTVAATVAAFSLERMLSPTPLTAVTS
jgi:hypothetical protein